MHGLINRAIESFVTEACGPDHWLAVTQRVGLGVFSFEAMLTYDDRLTEAVLSAAEAELGRPREDLLEDIGTYLVSNPKTEALRRLLRYGGVDFVDFLHSFEDLPDRARLAVPDLELPAMELRDITPGEYALILTSPHNGFASVFVGLLRAMADDYGTLVLLHHQGRVGEVDHIAITVIDAEFAVGRDFSLGAGGDGWQDAAE